MSDKTWTKHWSHGANHPVRLVTANERLVMQTRQDVTELERRLGSPLI